MHPEHDERALADRLREALDHQDAAALHGLFAQIQPGEKARLLSRLDPPEVNGVLGLLAPEAAAELVREVPAAQAVGLIATLAPEAAAAVLELLPSDQQADLLGDLDESHAEAILAELEPEQARIARELTRYPDDVAGGLMVHEYLAYPESATVSEVVDDLVANAESYRDFEVQYAYVTGRDSRLAGVLQLRDLLLARRDQVVRELMIADPVTVEETATLDELRALFDRKPFVGVPVVDRRRQLLGIVRRGDLRKALAERSTSDYLKSLGIVGGEELRSMPVALRSRRRLAWLSINIGLNVVAASVIALHQETIAAVVALAVFLPIISDMSGCAGNQAVAVSMRELSLGLARPREVLRVWAQEISVGMINGVVLGVLIGLVAWLWQESLTLGIVVGGAMALNTVIAVSIGGTVPLLLRRIGVDPALAAGPVLTTITDMCGFLLLLSFAAAVLPRLTG